jgi:predicted dehydrogenase
MKVLVVGLGGIGQRHLRNLRRLSRDVEIVAVRTRGLTRVLNESLAVEPGGDVRSTYGIQEAPNLDRALAADPDAVLICNPTSLHVPVALEAARAGRNLFIEKPLSDRWDRVDELIDQVARQHLVSAVGYQMRFHPCLRRLRELVTANAVGRVIAVNALVGEFLPAWHKYEDYRELYASRRDLGGGVILTQIHEIDYLTWLFGVPRRVFALGGHYSGLDVDVEDTASILMECVVDGVTVPVHVHQDYVMQPPARTCEVIGEDGRISVDFRAATLRVTDASGRTAETTSFEGFDRNDMFIEEMSHFLSSVRGETTPVVPVADGAISLRVALAARESLETRDVVTLA